MKYNKFIFDKKLKQLNSSIEQLEAEKEFINESFYFKFFRTDNLKSEPVFDGLAELVRTLKAWNAIQEHRFGSASNLICIGDKYFSADVVNIGERLDFFSAIFLAFLHQRNIDRKIKSLRRTAVFLQKCKEASVVTDKRTLIRHNIKNNLYRRNDEGDHLLTNIPNLFLARYWFEQIHKHHEIRKHKKSNRRHTMRAAIRRAGLERCQQAAFGMC